MAHEALFREWTQLKSWLKPERARLEVRSLQADAATWDRNGRDAAFLNHRDKRLGEATAVAGIERYRQRLFRYAHNASRFSATLCTKAIRSGLSCFILAPGSI